MFEQHFESHGENTGNLNIRKGLSRYLVTSFLISCFVLDNMGRYLASTAAI